MDLHVHTGRYSQCAEFVHPSEIGQRALARGLHGVVLTDHDMLWTEEEISALQQLCDSVRLYRGIECTAAGCHLVVIGLEEAGGIHRGSDAASVLDAAHAQGAAVILAHPFRDSDLTRVPLDQIDAIEVASTSFLPDEVPRAIALAAELSKPAVASSDAHALSRIGWAYTELPHLPKDDRELAAMITLGLGVPVAPALDGP